MDSIPRQIKFEYEITAANATNLRERWQLLIGIVGNFSILINGRSLYEEVEFCLLEYAIEANRWLSQVFLTGRDFIFESLESEEIGLVWIKKGNLGWRIGSVHQQYEELTEFSLEEITAATHEYIQQLQADLGKRSIDVAEYFL